MNESTCLLWKYEKGELVKAQRREKVEARKLAQATYEEINFRRMRNMNKKFHPIQEWLAECRTINRWSVHYLPILWFCAQQSAKAVSIYRKCQRNVHPRHRQPEGVFYCMPMQGWRGKIEKRTLGIKIWSFLGIWRKPSWQSLSAKCFQWFLGNQKLLTFNKPLRCWKGQN